MHADIATALARLDHAVVTRRGPFRLAALATLDGDRPEVRNIIIRQFSRTALTLVFFCRADDAKYREISACPHVELAVYGREPDCQVRLAGTAAIVTDAAALDRYWSEVSIATRRDYIADTAAAATDSDHPGRAALFAAIEVRIARVKVLTFHDDNWRLHEHSAS
jgi:pyridoxine/pyridoxamine 5'-phosphate oxidase